MLMIMDRATQARELSSRQSWKGEGIPGGDIV